jgi:hypothetical protein
LAKGEEPSKKIGSLRPVEPRHGGGSGEPRFGSKKILYLYPNIKRGALMGETPQPPRLDDMEDPSQFINDTLAKRDSTPNKVELPDAPFQMSEDKFNELVTGVGDLPLKHAPKEGEAVILKDGSNLGLASEVVQPFADQPSHYRFKVRDKIVHANVIGETV